MRRLSYRQMWAHLLFTAALATTFLRLDAASPPFKFLIRQKSLPYSKFIINQTIDENFLGQINKLMLTPNDGRASQEPIDLDLAKFAWAKMEQRLQEFANLEISRMRPYALELLGASNASFDCIEALKSLLDGTAEMKEWAALMWNAWGEIPNSGLTEGSLTDFGSYRGCLKIEPNELIGEPKYCLLESFPILPDRPRFHSLTQRVLDVQDGKLTGGDFDVPRTKEGLWARDFPSYRLKPPAPSGYRSNSGLDFELNSELMAQFARQAQMLYYVWFRIGSCWPSKCSTSDIQNIAGNLTAGYYMKTNRPTCTTRSEREHPYINIFQRVAIFLLVSMASLPVAATLIELLGGPFRAVGLCRCKRVQVFVEIFSIPGNMRRIFSTSDSSRSHQRGEQITCLRGLRFFTLLWVIMGHALLNMDYLSLTHAYDLVEKGLLNGYMLPLMSAILSVDIFFLISGLLSTYVIFSKKLKFHGLLFTIYRYIRLTPQLIIVMLLFILLPLYGDGPAYRLGTEKYAYRCIKNFWLNLLYVQTYIDRADLCVIPSWWLSIEMTFYILSIKIIHMFHQSFKGGTILCASAIAVFTSFGLLDHYMKGIEPAYLPSVLQMYEVETVLNQKFFQLPWPHAASYFIGLPLGFILAKKTIRKLSPAQLLLGWSACIFCLSYCLMGSYYWNIGYPYTRLQATLFYFIQQTLWPLAIGWIILVCSIGQGGLINEFLSAEFFKPFERISYMTYLSHMVYYYYFAASNHVAFEPSSLNLISMVISTCVISLALGTILTLLYEAPFLNIQALILRRAYQRMGDASIKEDTGVNGSPTEQDIQRDDDTTKLDIAAGGDNGTIRVKETFN